MDDTRIEEMESVGSEEGRVIGGAEISAPCPSFSPEESKCIAAAIRLVMQQLPGASKHAEVAERAEALITFDGYAGGMARGIVRSFVAKSPQQPGLGRKHGYWRIVQHVLSRREAAELFVKSFQPEAPLKCWMRIHQFVTDGLGLDWLEAY